jgi:glycogen operon protein
MTEAAWNDPQTTTLGVFLTGDPIGVDAWGDGCRDTSFLLWWHAGAHPVDVLLPASRADHYLEVVRTDAVLTGEKLEPGGTVSLLDRTFAMFAAVSG